MLAGGDDQRTISIADKNAFRVSMYNSRALQVLPIKRIGMTVHIAKLEDGSFAGG
jgi:hypothetical protein